MQIEVGAVRASHRAVDELHENHDFAAIDDFIDELGLTDQQARSIRTHRSGR